MISYGVPRIADWIALHFIWSAYDFIWGA